MWLVVCSISNGFRSYPGLFQSELFYTVLHPRKLDATAYVIVTHC